MSDLSRFERDLNRALFGTDEEPSFDRLRDDARAQLMQAQGADPDAARKIWETNQALPGHLRETSRALLDGTHQPLRMLPMDRQSLAERIAAGPGPKITEADVNGAVARVQYWQPEGTTQTVACVQLVNGFTVVGSSACADPANFNEQLGRDLALDDARDQIWHLLGFQLREELYRAYVKIGQGLARDVGATAAAGQVTSGDASRAALASVSDTAVGSAPAD